MEKIWRHPLQLLVDCGYPSLNLAFAILTQKLGSALCHFSFSHLSFIYDDYAVWAFIRMNLDMNQGSGLNPDYTLE